MIKIAIVDDHQLFRKSLALTLISFGEIQVVFDTDDGAKMLDFLREHTVDIVLIDLQMPRMDGFELCSEIRKNFTKIKVLIVSQLTTKEAIHKVMELGVNGFFTKNSPPEQLEQAIKSLVEKEYYFDIELSSVLREAYLWEKKFRDENKFQGQINLTRREIEILELSSLEMSSKEIAEKLFISVRTVETHRVHIMEKTKSKNFIGCIVFAIKNHFISIN
ncbi:response regulator transcription factor [Flavobacterium silvisoli]|uniref:Response regulator transcription factor n=1 Tax=Flavobacterium silvisoli TaxID=2529433 RepID=A0A4Q9YXM7_9FLAO|nr:response regulator transcription factor [Flavobacterium silvisoli]TBX66134.1 response regulator transcription factor [Flavobacterium silvisoli]